MEPLRLAICDDLPEEREALLALLEQAPIATVCAQFASSEELLEAFRPGVFDLLLMDIYMDGMTGVEAVRKIREMDETIPIAFTTTSTEHTLESYRLSVLKYLEKPVRQKDKILGKACTAKRHQRPAASGEAAKGQRSPADHPAKRRGAKALALGAVLSGAESPSCVSVSQGRRHAPALWQAVRPVAPAGGAALFLPSQKLLRQSGLCPGDQRGISVLRDG